MLQHLFSHAAVQPAIEAMTLMAGHDNQVCMFRPGHVHDSLGRRRATELSVGIDALTAQRTNQVRQLPFNRTCTCRAWISNSVNRLASTVRNCPRISSRSLA